MQRLHYSFPIGLGLCEAFTKREGLLSREEFQILAALMGEAPCLALLDRRRNKGGVVLSCAVPSGKCMCALHFAL
jgi:hypothetical protein